MAKVQTSVLFNNACKAQKRERGSEEEREGARKRGREREREME